MVMIQENIATKSDLMTMTNEIQKLNVRTSSENAVHNRSFDEKYEILE